MKHSHWCPQECSEGCHQGHPYECGGECKGFGGPKKKNVRCSLHAIYERVE